MYLLAPTALRVAPDDFPARVRARFASELRRAGRFAQLCLLGAQACLDAAGGDGPLAVLWASEFGALHAARAALAEDLARGEAAMPFTFIGSRARPACISRRTPGPRSRASRNAGSRSAIGF